jgi:hypothetical protein
MKKLLPLLLLASCSSPTETPKTTSNAVPVSSYTAYGPTPKDTFNLIDAKGMKQGKWVILGKMKKECDYGPDALVESGKYKDDKRVGWWKHYTKTGEVKDSVMCEAGK